MTIVQREAVETFMHPREERNRVSSNKSPLRHEWPLRSHEIKGRERVGRSGIEWRRTPFLKRGVE